MKILFDEDMPWDLADYFPDRFQVSKAQQLGWQSMANGALLSLAHENGFAALITRDKRMRHEQNPSALPVPVFILSVRQQNDFGYMGELISNHVIEILEQGAEKRFYLIGDGHKHPDSSPI